MKKTLILLMALILILVPMLAQAASIEPGDIGYGYHPDDEPDCQIDIKHRSTAGHDIHSETHIKGYDGQWVNGAELALDIETFNFSHAEPPMIQFVNGSRPLLVLYYEKVYVPVEDDQDDDSPYIYPEDIDDISQEQGDQDPVQYEFNYLDEADLIEERQMEYRNDDEEHIEIVHKGMVWEYVDPDNHVKIAMGNNQILIVTDGMEYTIPMDVEPYIKNDRVMMPLRFVGQLLGFEVSWDQETQTATLFSDDLKVEVTWGNEYAVVNGEEIYPLDVPLEMVNDRIMMPIGQLARILGLVENEDFYWDNEGKALYFMP